MLAKLLQLVALAGVASTVLAEAHTAPSLALKDIGNGVHVPGAIPMRDTEPLQHRLAYSGSDGMTVSWSTFAHIKEPTVWYGESPSQLDMKAKSCDSRTFQSSRTWNNHVKISGLKPNTKYYYRVAGTNQPGSAYLPTYSFVTARAAGDEKPLTIATFGDLGLMGQDGLSTKTGPIGSDNFTELGQYETNTIQSLLMNKDSYDFMYHVGDIGYADYFVKESVQGYFGLNNAMPTHEQVADGYESLSEQFFDQMTPITAEKPWMVLAGNHEANCVNGGVFEKHENWTVASCVPGQQNFTWYRNHYSMPTDEVGAVENMWYSFENGPVHFVSLLTEVDLGANLTGPIEKAKHASHGPVVNGPFGAPNQQIDWLKRDLASIDRKKTPWVVAAMHRPYYTSVQIPDDYPVWQQAFEDILYEHDVDMVLHGHVHTEEIFAPMYNGTIDPNGLSNPRAPLYIVQGAAGHYDGLDHYESDARLNGSIYSNDQAYGWGKLTFHNRTHATYDYVASRNSSVIHSETLYKEHAYDCKDGKKDEKKKEHGKGKKVNARASISL